MGSLLKSKHYKIRCFHNLLISFGCYFQFFCIAFIAIIHRKFTCKIHFVRKKEQPVLVCGHQYCAGLLAPTNHRKPVSPCHCSLPTSALFTQRPAPNIALESCTSSLFIQHSGALLTWCVVLCNMLSTRCRCIHVCSTDTELGFSCVYNYVGQCSHNKYKYLRRLFNVFRRAYLPL